MMKKSSRLLSRILLVTLCTMSTVFTAWAAGPGEGLTDTEHDTGVSKVITCGGEVTGTKQKKDTETTGEVTTEVTTTVITGEKGDSLGTFTTTGYCNCFECSSGYSLTYSGTVPKANHTLSADLNLFPIGTKLMINDIVYTVEDKGSSVNGRKLDIYYATHEEAEKHGTKYNIEVFAVK